MAFFASLYYEALARQMAEAGGIGLASLIRQQLHPGEEKTSGPPK